MRNPINELLDSSPFVYANLDDVDTQFNLRNRIIELGIPGLVDVQFKEEYRTVRITPVFESEETYVWYQLKYNDNPL